MLTASLCSTADKMMVQIISGGISDIGDKRTSNQDGILCVQGMIGGYPAGVFAVADGMGGLSYGQEISSYIISELKRWWELDIPQMIQDGYTDDESIQELLDQEIWDMNQTVLHFGKQTGKRSGSTLSLLFLLDRRYYIKNLGDSRIYQMRNGNFRKLTRDQKSVRLVQGKDGQKRYKSMLTMCIGVLPVPEADSSCGILRTGDQYLLCSDGLYRCLEEEKICSLLNNLKEHPEETAVQMRKSILPGQATDNISAVVVRVEKAGGLGRGASETE